MFRSVLFPTLLCLASLLAGCGSSTAPSSGTAPDDDGGDIGAGPSTPCADARPGFHNAYFGDLHTHTSFSIDAYFFQSMNGPREALRFAQGDPVGLPAGDEDPHTARRTVQLDRPLDFAAITDHAESIGNFRNVCELGGVLPADSNPACNLLGRQIRSDVRSFVAGDTSPALAFLQGISGELPTTRIAWQETQRINNEEYKPCRFTTMHAYEYTPNAFGQSVHRNIFFRNDTVPGDTFGAVGALSAAQPDNTNIEWELFDHLKQACVEVEGCDVFTIAHSANTANGRFFRPIDPATGLPPARDDQPLTVVDARLRAELERGFEISQHKGQSECAVGLGGGLLQGEETNCDFELFKHVCTGDADDPAECADYCTGSATDPAFCQHRDPLYAVDVCDTVTTSGSTPDGCTAPQDFVRDALTQGLAIQDRLDASTPIAWASPPPPTTTTVPPAMCARPASPATAACSTMNPPSSSGNGSASRRVASATRIRPTPAIAPGGCSRMRRAPSIPVVWPVCGPRKTRARRSGRRCAAARPGARPARVCACAWSPAGSPSPTT